jgi:hypothetical protein
MDAKWLSRVRLRKHNLALTKPGTKLKTLPEKEMLYPGETGSERKRNEFIKSCVPLPPAQSCVLHPSLLCKQPPSPASSKDILDN